MVTITKKVSVFNQDPEEMNDDDAWVLGSYAQTREMYDKEFTPNFPRILPVDLICIGIKSDPIPLKDVSDNFLDGFKRRYLGENLFVLQQSWLSLIVRTPIVSLSP